MRPGAARGLVQEYVEQGWDRIYLHHVGKEQEAFLDTFGDQVLPQLGQRDRR